MRATHNAAELPSDTTACVTCRGAQSFRWWADPLRADRRLDESAVAVYPCPCREQWILHRFLLHCGLGLAHQRTGWGDVLWDDDVAVGVRDYLDKAERLLASGMGMFIWGVSGVGKTLLATLLQRHLVSIGIEGYFLSFVDMISGFVATWKDADERAWFQQRVLQAPVLFVDDVGRERSAGVKPFQIDLLNDLLQYRLNAALPTVITAAFDVPDSFTRTGEFADRSYGSEMVKFVEGWAVPMRVTGPSQRALRRQRLVDEAALGLTRPVVLG